MHNNNLLDLYRPLAEVDIYFQLLIVEISQTDKNDIAVYVGTGSSRYQSVQLLVCGLIFNSLGRTIVQFLSSLVSENQLSYSLFFFFRKYDYAQ